MEIELKLEIPAADTGKLLKSALLKNSTTEHLTSVYFDTPNQKLRKAGVSIRVRHVGERRIQTIKMDKHAAAGLFVRAEHEQVIAGDVPVVDFLPDHSLKRLLNEKSLIKITPAFETRINRSIVQHSSRRADIELVLDQGEIHSVNGLSPVCEVELELRRGSQTSLFEMARRLDKIAPVRVGVLTKSERGYRLAAKETGLAVKAEAILLTAEMSTAAAFQVIAASCIRQFRLNEMALGEITNPEALHQARVGLRRLRSALSLFEPMLSDARFNGLRSEFKWIASVLGEARNIDVLFGSFTDEDILTSMRKGREQAYDRAAEAFASTRLRRLILDLAEWLACGDWLKEPGRKKLRNRPALQSAAEILDRYRKRVRRRGADLLQQSDAARHELRIEAKKLRYAVEFFASLYTGKETRRRVKRYRKALDELQNRLGELNDLATMPLVLDKLGIVASIDAPSERVSKAHSLRKTASAYADIIDAQRFWC